MKCIIGEHRIRESVNDKRAISLVRIAVEASDAVKNGDRDIAVALLCALICKAETQIDALTDPDC